MDSMSASAGAAIVGFPITQSRDAQQKFSISIKVSKKCTISSDTS